MAIVILHINIPNVGTLEVDDTVHGNSCSKLGSANLIMSGLIYVHWFSLFTASGSAPRITVQVSSTDVIHGIAATWNLSLGANAGVGAATDSKPSANAGASIAVGFTVSPTDSTIINATDQIQDQRSAYFSYQNLAASTSTALGNTNVEQDDTILITSTDNPAIHQKFLEKIVIPFS